MTGARDLASAHGTNKHVALPIRKTVARVNGHSSNGDGWYPNYERTLHAFPRRVVRNPWAGIVAPEADNRPTVVAAGKNNVDLVPTIGAILVVPQSARQRMD